MLVLISLFTFTSSDLDAIFVQLPEPSAFVMFTNTNLIEIKVVGLHKSLIRICLIVFIGAVQYFRSQRGSLSAAHAERQTAGCLGNRGPGQQHGAGPSQLAGEMGVCAGQSGREKGKEWLKDTCVSEGKVTFP